jgi:glycosyltransferase involved in cell wall biosynthesis
MMGKSKVVYVTSQAPFGNGEIWALHEIHALVAADVDVIIVPRTSTGKMLHRTAESLAPRTLTCPFMSAAVATSLVELALRRPLFLLSLLYWIAKQSDTLLDLAKGLFVLPKSIRLGRQLSDKGIVHVHAFSTTSVAVVAHVLSRMLDVDWSFTMNTSVNLTSRYRRSGNAHLQSARFVRLPSREVEVKLTTFTGGAFLPKHRLVHMGVDCPSQLRATKHAPGDFTVASVGGLLPHKGHQYSIEAAHILQNRGISKFRWIIFGDGPERQRLSQLVEKRKLQAIVSLPGAIENEQLRAMYLDGSIDLVALSSVRVDGIQEGIPVALMEAMSVGTPVVATDSGGTLELIGDGVGVFVPQRDSAALAGAIEHLMSSPECLSTVGNRGKAKVESEFNSVKTARALKQLYAESGHLRCS